MTSKGQITKIASRDGVDARVVERDYVLVHIVALISAHDAGGTLIFKGGTSLSLLHFDEYRYSADLDYSVVIGSEEKARELIEGALARRRPETIKELGLAGGAIVYVGPLGAPRTIKLDLADDERRSSVAFSSGANVETSSVSIYCSAHKTLLQPRICFTERRHIGAWIPPRSPRSSRSASRITRTIGTRSSSSI